MDVILNIYVLKAVRSFTNALLSISLIYTYYRYIQFQSPYRVPLNIALVLLLSSISSTLSSYLARRFGHFKAYLFGCFIVTFSFKFWEGVFPIDGHDLCFFDSFHLKCLKQVSKSEDQAKRTERNYTRIGYCFQGLASILFGLYMQISQQNLHLDEKYIYNVYLLLYTFSFINLILFAMLYFGQNGQIFQKIVQRDLLTRNLTLKIGQGLRAWSFLSGLPIGLLSVPFIVYFSDLKLNLYYEEVGFLIGGCFFLKGFGQQICRRFIASPTLQRISFAANIFIAAIVVYPRPIFSAIGILMAFFFMDYNRVKLQARHMVRNGPGSEDLRQVINFWEKKGCAFGILGCIFAFTTLYYRPVFAYPFVLYAILREVICRYHSKSAQIQPRNTEVKEEDIMSLKHNQGNECEDDGIGRGIESKGPPVSHDTHRHELKSQSGQFSRKIFTIFGLVLYFMAFGWKIYSFCYKGTLTPKLRAYKTDSIIEHPQLSLYNQSLAHYLLRQNLSSVNLHSCEPLSKGQTPREFAHLPHYSMLNYTNADGQWSIFCHAPYFSSHSSVQSFLAPIVNSQIQGFSIFWDTAMRYETQCEQIQKFIIQFSQREGFHYEEMPTLNLRAAQHRMMLIFSRWKKLPGELPAFVKSRPPRNKVAIVTKLKMVSNVIYLREFILYHLSIGVDKFFLYDNDRPIGDPSFFFQYRTSEFLEKCLPYNLSQEYTIFQELWEDFYDHIVYIPYYFGGYYDQASAFENYHMLYNTAVDYSVFTDVDEFVYSPSGSYLPDILVRLEAEDYVVVRMLCRYFMHRLCLPRGAMGIEQYNMTVREYENTTRKLIIKNKMIINYGIHDRSSKNGKIAFEFDPVHDLTFLHYKITTDPSDNEFYKSAYRDESMKPFVAGIKEACKGKCSDSFVSSCSPEKELKPLCEMHLVP